MHLHINADQTIQENEEGSCLIESQALTFNYHHCGQWLDVKIALVAPRNEHTIEEQEKS